MLTPSAETAWPQSAWSDAGRRLRDVSKYNCEQMVSATHCPIPGAIGLRGQCYVLSDNVHTCAETCGGAGRVDVETTLHTSTSSDVVICATLRWQRGATNSATAPPRGRRAAVTDARARLGRRAERSRWLPPAAGWCGGGSSGGQRASSHSHA